MDLSVEKLKEENRILKQYVIELNEDIAEYKKTNNNLQMQLQEIQDSKNKYQDLNQQQQKALEQYKQLLKRVSSQMSSQSVLHLTQSIIQKTFGQSISQIVALNYSQVYTDQSESQSAFNQEIFEAFYIFGIDKIDSTNQSQYVVPSNYKILYQQYKQRYIDQPNNEEFQNFKGIEKDIEQFIHPSGVEAQRMCDENIDFEIKKILAQRIKFENFYLINLKGDDLMKNPLNIKILQSFNHERQLYGYCTAIDDFLRQTDKNGQVIYWKVKKVLCFITYFPIQSVFYELFEQILFIIKQWRYYVMKKDEDLINQIDGVKIVNDTAQLLNKIIQKLSKQSIKKYGDDIDVNFSSIVEGLLPTDFIQELQATFKLSKFRYKVPDQKSLYFEIKKLETHIVLQLFKLEQFFMVFEEILKEGRIVFCCQNQHLLTAVVSFFYTILKPFKWLHQVIYNLKIESVIVEQFDVPILIGVNMPYSNLRFNQKVIMINKQSSVLYVDINDNLQLVNIIEYKRKVKHQCWDSQKKQLAKYFIENQKSIGGQIAFTPNQQDEERIKGFLEELEIFIRDYLIQKIIPNKEEGFVLGNSLNKGMVKNAIKIKIEKEITNKNDLEFIRSYILEADYFQEYLKHIYIK
ncbi:unnamed protein product (macronuclear) [Paramecium tetraurelia]|uniref:cDENN domain-containing protein n=1 Tax=Paramecium tetraurelia TaxID=5888 RepID=A0E248_PARTE|nr:uncharacterized protein GSPATT00022537001 [Paramecium tetraurelia]CAK89365.1 unnamed protein product [Paramecium tetraurelia]|eukprot:XP_001456762.1 hypothetical protein (macronuclear) [Paramecium tetraurelia strain d4-2]